MGHAFLMSGAGSGQPPPSRDESPPSPPSAESYRLLIETVRDHAITILDTRGRVASWNRAAEQMIGYRADEILGEHFSRLYPEEDVRSGKCDQALAAAVGDGRHEEDSWRVRKSGERFWANTVIAPLRDGEGRLVGYGVVTHDLTADRNAAEERARLAQSEEAHRAKDEFLAAVSHELRTPLQAILGWSRMLRGTELDEQRRARAIETIERNAIMMTQLIEDLLDVSRLIGGKMRLDVRAVDLVSVIEAAVDAIRPAAEAKEILLETTLDAGVGSVLGDAGRLQQIVWNLLSNAVKFTDRGGRVSIALRGHGPSAEIVVSDNGQGIDPRLVPHIFEPFRQPEGTWRGSRRGLGLGLAITRQLVELHGGSISGQSEGEGKGATFSVSLPLATAEPRPRLRPVRPARKAEPFAPLPELRGINVLVVDDEDDARELMRAVLEECGSHVVTASSVAEAMEALEESVPDVLISDIGMPGENGYDLIRRVRALSPAKGGNVPAAALTAYARAEDRRKVLTAGYEMHVPKPVDPAELVNVVATLSSRGRDATFP
jgi:PAS domain S-box-containing protein